MDKELEPCPVCHGDCGSANPPPIFCPMRDATDTPAATAEQIAENANCLPEGGEDFCANNAQKSDDAEREGLVGELEGLVETYRNIPYYTVDYEAVSDAAKGIANLLAENPAILTALRADHGELRDQVIEECAKVAEQYVTQAQSDDQHDRVHQATGIVKDIRALKGSKT